MNRTIDEWARITAIPPISILNQLIIEDLTEQANRIEYLEEDIQTLIKRVDAYRVLLGEEVASHKKPKDEQYSLGGKDSLYLSIIFEKESRIIELEEALTAIIKKASVALAIQGQSHITAKAITILRKSGGEASA